MKRRGLVLVTALTFGAVVFGALIFGAAPVRDEASAQARNPAGSQNTGSQNNIDVDVALVLAVDISYSMDPDELALQREGYARALTSREFLYALRQGIHGRIAVIYVEWAGADEQRVVVPWRLVEGPESADSFAGDILLAPLRRAARTSISGALLFSMDLLEQSPYRALRRVIDVSGDGANNHGQIVTVARDQVLARGVTINGLPILLKQPSYATMDIGQLAEYYEDCVIGGPGAFMVTVSERDKFVEAIRTKLVLEVAGKMPQARVIPAAASAPRVSCTIGERIWRDRWGN